MTWATVPYAFVQAAAISGVHAGLGVPGQGVEEALAHGREVRGEGAELAVITAEVSAEADEVFGGVDHVHDAQQRAQEAIALGIHPFREHRTDVGIAGEKDRVEIDRYLPRERLDHRQGSPDKGYLVVRQRRFRGLRLFGVDDRGGGPIPPETEARACCLDDASGTSRCQRSPIRHAT
ncbi:hypothetical protein GCM10020000_67970 [Streptomyces olivoverticillatus]